MAVEFKASMTKAELLKIAAENGVTADDSMTKTAMAETALIDVSLVSVSRCSSAARYLFFSKIRLFASLNAAV